ncbi:hypothetical protein [Enterococcus olivae]
MDTNDEKKYIYEQLKLIIVERRRLAKIYYQWKQKLENLHVSTDGGSDTNRQQPIDLKKESEYQRYKGTPPKRKGISYQEISLTIASILKEAERPLKNQEILEQIIEAKGSVMTIRNLTCTILPRMNKDQRIPVERAYRGYWQYRLH